MRPDASPSKRSRAWAGIVVARRASIVALAACASMVACGKDSTRPSAFPGMSAEASAPSGVPGDDLDELAALEARLAGLRGELDRSNYLAQVPGDRAFEAQVESVALGDDEAERSSPKRGASRDRASRRESKAKKDGEGAGGAAAPSAPAEEAPKVSETERTSQEQATPITGGDSASADAATASAPASNFADETETCPKVCSLSESICELTDRVCSLASRHEGEPRFEAACGRAKTDCSDAVAACTACTVGE